MMEVKPYGKNQAEPLYPMAASNDGRAVSSSDEVYDGWGEDHFA